VTADQAVLWRRNAARPQTPKHNLHHFCKIVVNITNLFKELHSLSTALCCGGGINRHCSRLHDCLRQLLRIHPDLHTSVIPCKPQQQQQVGVWLADKAILQ
jgi:hypothetical protein